LRDKLAAVYHYPGDLLASKTSARDRRSFSAWVAIICTVLWFFRPSWIALIGFMSVVALWSVVTGETPVEMEKDAKPDQ